MQQQKITDDLDALLQVLPPSIEQALREANQGDSLLEIVMDLGRRPEARFVDHELVLRASEITDEDLNCVIERIGLFTGDNRGDRAYASPHLLHPQSSESHHRPDLSRRPCGLWCN